MPVALADTAIQWGGPASNQLRDRDQLTRDELMDQAYQSTDWHCLADLKPAQRQLCEWKFAVDSYTEHGVGAYYAGENASGFSSDKGAFVSDPARTYWKAAKTSLEYQASALQQEAIWQKVKNAEDLASPCGSGK